MSQILKEKGNQAFKQGNYLEADELYRDSIILDPSNPVLYSNRAMTSIKLSNWSTCIEVCNTGMKVDPDSKTKVKLLWRRGIAYSKLNDFKSARESYELALTIDSKNVSILRSIEDLNKEETQFKRSHSIGEFEADKRIKKSSIEKIPIYEVDELPREFSESTSVRTQVPVKPKEPVNSSKIVPIQKQLPPQSSSFTNNFPDIPTVYQLTTLIKSNSGNPAAYRYILSIKASTYQKLFSGGSIDAQFLNFLLDSYIFTQRELNKSHNDDNIIELLTVLAKAPRFSLVKLFIDKSKLETIKKLATSESLKSALNLWI